MTFVACTAEPLGCITSSMNTHCLDSNLCRIRNARHWVSKICAFVHSICDLSMAQLSECMMLSNLKCFDSTSEVNLCKFNPSKLHHLISTGRGRSQILRRSHIFVGFNFQKKILDPTSELLISFSMASTTLRRSVSLGAVGTNHRLRIREIFLLGSTKGA